MLPAAQRRVAVEICRVSGWDLSGSMSGFRSHPTWISLAPVSYTHLDLGDLRVGVRPRIFRVRYEFVDQPHLDMLHHCLQSHGSVSGRVSIIRPLNISRELQSSTVRLEKSINEVY